MVLSTIICYTSYRKNAFMSKKFSKKFSFNNTNLITHSMMKTNNKEI